MSDAEQQDNSKLEIKTIAATLGAYALNVAYGAVLAPFEKEHLISLAKLVGCTVAKKHLSFIATRAVLEELLAERRAQIEVHGYTLEYDDANPEHAHQQVLSRADQMPTAHARKDLVELAAIAVAEIERLDRAAAKASQPAPEEATLDQVKAIADRPRIITVNVYPPIPIRTSDWCAYYDGTEEEGNVGWGETEQKAIEDLLNLDL